MERLSGIVLYVLFLYFTTWSTPHVLLKQKANATNKGYTLFLSSCQFCQFEIGQCRSIR